MAERGITSEMIQAVVGSADITTARADGCTEYTGSWQGRRLKVVVDVEQDPELIVTVHWT
jgi:hypothetical protein